MTCYATVMLVVRAQNRINRHLIQECAENWCRTISSSSSSSMGAILIAWRTIASASPISARLISRGTCYHHRHKTMIGVIPVIQALLLQWRTEIMPCMTVTHSPWPWWTVGCCWMRSSPATMRTS